MTGNVEADSLKCTPVEEKVDSEMVPEEEVVIANDDNEIKTDKENDAAVSNTITDIATEEAAVIECVGDKESPCEVEDNVESLFEDSGEKVIEEITEEHDKDTQHLLNEKLEILEEDLEENKMGKNQDDASKTEEDIPSSDVITEVANSEELALVTELKQESGSEFEAKEESEIPSEDQQKLEVENVDGCYENVGLGDSDSEVSEDEIIDYSQPDVSLSLPLLSSSLATTDTNSFVTAQETVAIATDESKTDELNDFEAVLDSAATGTPSEDTSMPVSQEVSPEDNHEGTAAVETPLSEEAESEIVRAEEESPNSDESTDSDSSLPLPSSPPPTSQEANIDNVDASGNNLKANLEEALISKSTLLNESSTENKVLKSEPLSNGHISQLHTTCSDRSFTGGDNSSLPGRISTGVTGVAFDEIVMRKHNKDKVDLGPVMGEMCILDPLLEERETSEESIGKPPMILRK